MMNRESFSYRNPYAKECIAKLQELVEKGERESLFIVTERSKLAFSKASGGDHVVRAGFSLKLLYTHKPVNNAIKPNKLYLYSHHADNKSIEYAVINSKGKIERRLITQDKLGVYFTSIHSKLNDTSATQRLTTEEINAIYQVTSECGYIKRDKTGKDSQGFIGTIDLELGLIDLVPAYNKNDGKKRRKNQLPFFIESTQALGQSTGDAHMQAVMKNNLVHKAGANGLMAGFGIFKGEGTEEERRSFIYELRNKSSGLNMQAFKYNPKYELSAYEDSQDNVLFIKRKMPAYLTKELVKALCEQLPINEKTQLNSIEHFVDTNISSEDEFKKISDTQLTEILKVNLFNSIYYGDLDVSHRILDLEDCDFTAKNQNDIVNIRFAIVNLERMMANDEISSGECYDLQMKLLALLTNLALIESTNNPSMMTDFATIYFRADDIVNGLTLVDRAIEINQFNPSMSIEKLDRLVLTLHELKEDHESWASIYDQDDATRFIDATDMLISICMIQRNACHACNNIETELNTSQDAQPDEDAPSSRNIFRS